MRTSDKARVQTLNVIEEEADRHRIGCSIYTAIARKLKGQSYNVHSTRDNEQSRSDNKPVPHVKMLKREKEPDIQERLHIWNQTQSEEP